MRFGVRLVSERRVTAAIFTTFLAAGATALAAAFLILGQMITGVSEGGSAGPLYVIAAGALAGTLTAFVIHEVGVVLPAVVAHLHRG